METTYTAVHLPTITADALLQGAGWTIEPIASGGVAFVRPGHPRRRDGGEFATDYLWERDEALTQHLEHLASA